MAGGSVGLAFGSLSREAFACPGDASWRGRRGSHQDCRQRYGGGGSPQQSEQQSACLGHWPTLTGRISIAALISAGSCDVKFQGLYRRESESTWDDLAGSKNLGKFVHVSRAPLVSLKNRRSATETSTGQLLDPRASLFSALQPAVLGGDKRWSPGRVMGDGVVT